MYDHENCACDNSSTKQEHNSNHKLVSAPTMHLVAFALIIFLGSLVANNVKKFKLLGLADRAPYTISIEGVGKVTATPNIAVTNIGLVTEKPDVAAAQAENSEKMNKLIAALQALQISKDDIQTTQYQINPKYSYDLEKGNAIIGYAVSQSVGVKIRDLNKISQVLGTAGTAGANQVGGIQFTIDDPKNLRIQARDEAIKDASEKVKKLTETLGVRLGRVVNFNESQGGGVPEPQMPIYSHEGMSAKFDAAPSIQGGTLEIQSNVSVTYEIQ